MSNKITFADFLDKCFTEGKPLFFDGGMGTMIQASGVTGYSIPEDLNFSNAELIKGIHRKYLDSGSNVITANTFGANPIKLGDSKISAESYITESIKLMKEAISECEKDGNNEPHFAAWDSGQIGKLIEPMGTLTFDEAYESYKTACVAAEKAGADLAVIETMSDLYEVKAAVLAVKENTNLPVVASMTFQENLRTLTGADVLTVVTYLEALGVNAIGFNCGGSLADAVELTKQFVSYSHIPVLAQPNAGLPVVEDGRTFFKVTPQEFAECQAVNRKAGVVILGGCCGTTPDHIKCMREKILAECSGSSNSQQFTGTGDGSANSQRFTGTGDSSANSQQLAETGSGSSNSQQFEKTGSSSPNSQQFEKTGSGSPNSQQFTETGSGSSNSQQFEKTGSGSPNSQPFEKTGSSSPNSQPFEKTGSGSPNSQQFTETGSGSPNSQQFTETGSSSPNSQQFEKTGSSPEKDSLTFICSYNKTVQCGNNAGPVIIGERINPTGKKKCKEALLNSNMQFVLDEAESQINAGAQILDVNVGLPGIDEKEMMLKAVKTIQGTFSTPLQIDSSEAPVLEKALRYYNGKALVNSVNGKQETMDKVFPLIRKYGGSVVALCIDEEGISPTAEGRVKVAEKIISEAAKYGIKPRDIFIDTLTLTVSSEQKTALETIKAITILKEKYGSQGLKFVLGVSNISFGLPRRDIINSRFLAIALNAGLTACIINPLSETMMDSYCAYRTLAGFDENCLSYIEKYTGTEEPYAAVKKMRAGGTASVNGTTASPADRQITTPTNGGEADKNTSTPTNGGETDKNTSTPTNGGETDSTTPSEKEFISVIEKGFKEKAAVCAKQLLETEEPVEIINRCIVPALDNVGKDFETGRKFLPQLLLSAETVGNAFTVIKEYLASTGKKEESKGTIVIATVFGDIHDIGKNIVKAMLENYGYTVIDLGKNVPSQQIIDTVLKNNIKLVGLSALMTTTVESMKQTIIQLRKALNENSRECKIMVGGAVLTPEYAAKIGADYYSKDAMNSVAIAKEVFGK